MKPQKSNHERYRKILEMWEDGLPGKEIARRNFISTSAVYVILQRYSEYFHDPKKCKILSIGKTDKLM